jgi:hypothetical protein
VTGARRRRCCGCRRCALRGRGYYRGVSSTERRGVAGGVAGGGDRLRRCRLRNSGGRLRAGRRSSRWRYCCRRRRNRRRGRRWRGRRACGPVGDTRPSAGPSFAGLVATAGLSRGQAGAAAPPSPRREPVPEPRPMSLLARPPRLERAAPLRPVSCPGRRANRPRLRRRQPIRLRPRPRVRLRCAVGAHRLRARAAHGYRAQGRVRAARRLF